jgi:EAL domain-containing protein (putative c-di-GMP-specific phosphodiesterase class I)
VLKVDRSFVADLGEESPGAAIVAATPVVAVRR